MFKIKAFDPVTLTIVRNGEFVSQTLKAGDTTFTELSTPQLEQARKNKSIFIKTASQSDLAALNAGKNKQVAKNIKVTNLATVQKLNASASPVSSTVSQTADKPISDSSKATASTKTGKTDVKSGKSQLDKDSDNLIKEEGK